jgi:hypothetical protein
MKKFSAKTPHRLTRVHFKSRNSITAHKNIAKTLKKIDKRQNHDKILPLWHNRPAPPFPCRYYMLLWRMSPLKRLFIPLSLSLLLCLFFACSSKESAEQSASFYLDAAEVATGSEELPAPAFRDMSNVQGESSEETAANPDAGAIEKERKLVKSAEISIRVDNLDEAKQTIAEMLERHRAYSSYTIARNNSVNYTLKIPVAFYETALTGISGMGKVLYSSERVEDTTIKFYDLDSRLTTKKELLATFRSYLGQAKTIDEIMSVEERLAELQQEIDWLGSQLSNLSHLIEYATIDLQLQGPVADSVYYEPGIKERIGELFNSFGDYLSTVLVILTGIIIYGIPSLIIILLLFWVLFGKIGLLKKAWRLVAGEKVRHKKSE